MARRREPQGSKARKSMAGVSGAAIAAVADPLMRIRAAAEACGLTPGQIEGISAAVKRQLQPVGEGLRQVSSKQLLGYLDDLCLRILESVDDATIAEANFRDRMIGLGIAMEKRQLLRGEPTQILTFEERRHINDLLPAMLREARRRGMVIDVAADEVRVLPPEGVQREAVDATARKLKGALPEAVRDRRA